MSVLSKLGIPLVSKLPHIIVFIVLTMVESHTISRGSAIRKRFRRLYTKTRQPVLFITALTILLYVSLAGSVAFADSSVVVWNYTYSNGYRDCVDDAVKTFDGGFAFAGRSTGASGTMDTWLIKTNSDGTVQWNKTYSTYSDCNWNAAYSVIQTSDSGYALTGEIDNASNGEGDVWVVRTDAQGNQLWNQTYGYEADSWDYGNDIIQTEDGGYLLVGETDNASNGWGDVWIIKMDANGAAEWNQTYDNGGDYDSGSAVIPTSDGYLITGYTSLNNTVWVIKIDPCGTVVWNRTYEQSGYNGYPGNSIESTSDGGFVIPCTLANNASLMKIDSAGNLVFVRIFGRGNGDYAISTADGGYELTGYTRTSSGSFAQVIRTDPDGKMLWRYTYNPVYGEGSTGHYLTETSDGHTIVCGNYYKGSTNFGLLLKLNTSAITPLPVNLYGPDTGNSVITTSDGGYLIGGENGTATLIKTDMYGNLMWQKSYSGYDVFSVTQDYSGYAATGEIAYQTSSCAYVLKTDINGNIIWQKEYPDLDYGMSIAATSDGYVITGRTDIPSSGTGRSSIYALYLTKLDSEGNIIWNKTFVGPHRDYWGNAQSGNNVIVLNDGYLITGETSDYSSHSWVYVVKTDFNGNLLWQNTYGGNKIFTEGRQALAVNDGYVILGYTNSFSNTDSITGDDFYLVKTDFYGNLVWQQTYGEIGIEDRGYSIVPVSDGYLLAGNTYNKGYGAKVIKTDLNGNEMWNTTYRGQVGDSICGYSIALNNVSGYVVAGNYYRDNMGDNQICLINLPKLSQGKIDLAISGEDITFEKVI